jgi:hypothetical protein
MRDSPSSFLSRANAGFPPLNVCVKLLLFCIFAAPALGSTPLDSADDAYANGRFEEAKVEYLHLIQEHQYSPDLFYNLGNAWFRLSDFGRAILNYRRALVLDPNFSEAQANLKTSLKLAGNYAPPAARDKIDRYADYLPVLMSAAVWCAIFLFAIPWLFRKPAPSAIWIAGSSMVILAVATMILLIGTGKGEKDPTRGIVVESAADLKYGPAVSARPIESLRVGDTVKLISKRGEWTFCKARTGTVGWIPTQKVESLVP